MKTAAIKDVAPASPSTEQFEPDRVVWQLTLDQIASNTGEIESPVYARADQAGNSTHLFDQEHVLYSKLRPNLNKVLCPTEPGISTTELIPLRPDKKRLDRKYLCYYLRSAPFVDWITSRTAGAKMPRVQMSAFWSHQIPLPSLSEQRRIAGILDQADAICRQRRAALDELNTLIPALFHDMFGGFDGRKFALRSILDFSCVIKTGATPSRKVDAFFGGDIPWVKTTEVTGDYIKQTSEHLTEAGLENSRCEVFPKGSIVIALYGQGRTRGRCAMLGINAATNQACAVILPTKNINMEYLWSALLISYDRLRELARGGNQPNLNLRIVGDFTVPNAPPNLQHAFAEKVSKIRDLQHVFSDALTESDTLFHSLVQRAFRGEL